jgi:hypothetical protein
VPHVSEYFRETKVVHHLVKLLDALLVGRDLGAKVTQVLVHVAASNHKKKKKIKRTRLWISCSE